MTEFTSECIYESEVKLNHNDYHFRFVCVRRYIISILDYHATMQSVRWGTTTWIPADKLEAVGWILESMWIEFIAIICRWFFWIYLFFKNKRIQRLLWPTENPNMKENKTNLGMVWNVFWHTIVSFDAGLYSIDFIVSFVRQLPESLFALVCLFVNFKKQLSNTSNWKKCNQNSSCHFDLYNWENENFYEFK